MEYWEAPFNQVSLFLYTDLTEQRRKKKEGGMCFMVNNKWCDSRNIKILSRSWSPDLELLSVKCRLHFLPREFTSVMITAVYIPPQVCTETALSDLCKNFNYSLIGNPDAALIVAGDFNQANLKKVMPAFHQHIDCTTRGNKHAVTLKCAKQTPTHAPSDTRGQKMVRPIRGHPRVCTTWCSLMQVPGYHWQVCVGFSLLNNRSSCTQNYS